MSDCFQKLGLSPSATKLEVKQAWRKLCMIHHPDRGGTDQQFQELTVAFEEALKLAEVVSSGCSKCNGTGYIDVALGFSVIKTTCICQIKIRKK
jgi:DnaJ-class molecular chaperone